MSDSYEDIMDMPHHVSKTRAQMPRRSRAAQFAPFAALTGYEDAVCETARRTDIKAELCEDDAAELNEKIRLLGARIAAEPYCEVTYFVPDKHKSGGRYVTVSGNVRFIEEVSRQLVFCGGLRVPLDDIMKISL
ncbi:MAG: hypothetical protein K6G33_08250 [Ruminococcus sp.]|uniref:hypothetical protein n=1 Tax=Ruminococcus sp. TaxID=41978 RepID=UPI0025EFC4A7|nr:hypothetical protein [Ruminococcus sp.]MCR5600715.1 hypothetical protein [Ruminococcus sp.]